MDESILGEGAAAKAGKQLRAVPLSRQAAIEAQLAGNQTPTATPAELATKPSPSMLRRLAMLLRQ